MSATLNLGTDGNWATKDGSLLGYNNENGNYKPLPFNFERSTSATRVNKEGLIEVVSNNEPRIDFTNDSKGALKLEPSRSNLILSSENISGAGWGRSGWTLTNDFISPDGTDNAYSILRTTGIGVSTTLSLLANTKYTFSVYVKNVNATNIQLRVQNTAGNTSGTEDNCVVFSVTDQTNTDDFVRITHTFNTGDAGSYGMFLGYFSAGEYIVWGAQLEQGSYATSYIPTSGSIGTRVAESCNGAGNEQVFNDSEGVLFAEISPLNENGRIALNDGTVNNNVRLVYSSSLNLIDAILFNGINQVSLSYFLPKRGAFNKIAFKYKENDFALWVDGIEVDSQVGSGTTFTSGTLSELDFDAGSNGLVPFYGKTKEIKYFDKALTDAELQALTKI